MRLLNRFFSLAIFLTITSCGPRESADEQQTLFRLVDPGKSGVTFLNQLDYTEELNTYTFKNFYNGGGVGIGDINNDGLADLFFSGNLVSNKLYLNKGNMRFEDITAQAGLERTGFWTTGISMADINGDGLLDLYLCKSGPPGGDHRHNELFINNGNLTFTERSAEYGLGFEGLSTHAGFFDYDKDGDLDCYLLNNSIRSVGGYDLRERQREIPDPKGGNKLLRNDQGKFADVSSEAGIYTSEIGFGLGVTIGDVDKDGWQDIYVSNDFFEKDYLYINNGNGTFTESLEAYLREISLGSMGADLADINNDALPEIFVTEMLPESDARLKTTSQFETWDRYRNAVDKGYYHQFSRNVLQLNNGDGTFSEVGRFAGVHATDWSWGALIFDMDLDGQKDIFVANGIYKDLLDHDYVNFVSNPNAVREILRRENAVIKRLIDSIPSNRIPNYAFRNNGNLTFTNVSQNWGFGEPSHSNGSAYGDLDNDGDLDLVLSNVNMPSAIYENFSAQNGNHWLSLSLRGPQGNISGFGAKVNVYSGDDILYQEQSPMRGFMSSVDPRLNFGLGKRDVIDSVVIEWPDTRVITYRNLPADTLLTVNYSVAVERSGPVLPGKPAPVLKVLDATGVNFVHRENKYVDFDRDRLLYNMASNEGPCLCSGDLDGDGLTDFYVGGAKDQAGALYMQQPSGKFTVSNPAIFEADKGSEDTDCIFFDANNDKRTDLFVASGGTEFSSSSAALLSRLYINQGNGRLFKKEDAMPGVLFQSLSTVHASDYDRDGDQDLFLGVRLMPFYYGLPAASFVLENDGKAIFKNVTALRAKPLEKAGMITGGSWLDANKDGDLDLVVCGEWMPLRLMVNERGTWKDVSVSSGLDSTHGWYNEVVATDLNHDGFTDLVAGNHGLNSRFRASRKEPVNLYINDFDQNGKIEHILTRYDQGQSYPLVQRAELVAQIPSLKKKFLYADHYKNKGILDIFTPAQMERTIRLDAFTFETAAWLNDGKGSFAKVNLPVEAQFTPVYAILADDFDHDGNVDLLLGGNLYRAKPETGIYDASYALLLKGDGAGGFSVLTARQSGISIKGEIRAFESIPYRGKKLLIVGKNNDQLEFFTY